MSDLENLKDEELLLMLEETMDKAELLQNQNSEAQQTILNLSSEVSMLKKELQKKSETIVFLNEKIEKYSESDLVLKKNEELKSENESLKLSEKRTKEKAEAEVKAVKVNAQRAIAESETKSQKAIGDLADRESKVSIRESKIEWEVGQRAGKIVREFEQKLWKNHEEKQKQLSKKYETMTIKYKSVLYASLLYGIITTLITAIQSETIQTDLIRAVQILGQGTKMLVFTMYEAIKTIAGITSYIPNEVLAIVVYWVIIVFLSVAMLGIVGIGLFIVGRKYYNFFVEYQKDELTVFVCVMDLALMVFASNIIKTYLPVNIVIIGIVIFCIYSALRGVIEMKDKDAQYKLVSGVIVSFIGVGVTALLIHMIGGWIILALPIAVMIIARF